MTASAIRTPEPGDRLVWLADGLTFSVGSDSWKQPGGLVSRRGQAVTLTRGMLDANRDRFGNSFLDLLHDPDGQRERWGEERMRPLGPDEEVPRALREPIPGSVEAGLAYDRERLRILSEVGDPDARDRALTALRERYRPRSSQSTTFVRGNSGNTADDEPRRGTGTGRA